LTFDIAATDEYTHRSLHVTQPYTGTTADIMLAPRQHSDVPSDCTQRMTGLAGNM